VEQNVDITHAELVQDLPNLACGSGPLACGFFADIHDDGDSVLCRSFTRTISFAIDRDHLSEIQSEKDLLGDFIPLLDYFLRPRDGEAYEWPRDDIIHDIDTNFRELGLKGMMYLPSGISRLAWDRL
jgi:hypothetical protein